MKQEVRLDCRHFLGEKPCAPHKLHGVLCTCEYFAPWRQRILIIKLAAPGDVLRTTCILPELKKAHPESYVCWVAGKESLPLLAGNPFLDEVIPWDEKIALRLAAERFDLLLSLDVCRAGGHAASITQAEEKLGFGCNVDGKVYPLNPEAEEWFIMGVFDPFKKANRKSYPRILHEICRLAWTGERPVLRLGEEERQFAARFAREHGLDRSRKVVGLFTGAGTRWRHKAWTEEGIAGLIGHLLEEQVGQVLLLGGPQERERNGRLVEAFAGRVIDGGWDNPMREFSALVDLCDVLVTADTLALHVATALGKKAVALVGPTSAAEIDLYGTVVVSAERPCLCCYRARCDEHPSCMETINPGKVFSAVQSLL